MSQPAFDDWYLDPQQDGPGLSEFPGHTDLPPEEEAKLWREQDFAAVAYDDLFDDDDDI